MNYSRLATFLSLQILAATTACAQQNRPDSTTTQVRKRLLWHLTRIDRHGIERLHVGTATVSTICEARTDAQALALITVTTDQPFTLVVSKNGVEKPFDISPGTQKMQFSDSAIRSFY